MFFLLLLAEFVVLSRDDSVSAGTVLRWTLFAVLFITAKAQNAPLSLPLSLYLLAVAWRPLGKKLRALTLVCVALTLAAGVLMYKSPPPAIRVTNVYNVIFFAILPESESPRADLIALGLDPAYVQYSGTQAWSPGTGVGDGYLVNALQERITPIKLALFYLRRPNRLWKHISNQLLVGFSLRPEYCGNYDRSAGQFPGARSRAIALWSYFHERELSRIGPGILLGVLILSLGGYVLLLTRTLSLGFRRWVETGTCLLSCCFLAFMAAALGDASDTVKHLLIFNLLLDSCLVFFLTLSRPWLRSEPRASARGFR